MMHTKTEMEDSIKALILAMAKHNDFSGLDALNNLFRRRSKLQKEIEINVRIGAFIGDWKFIGEIDISGTLGCKHKNIPNMFMYCTPDYYTKMIHLEISMPKPASTIKDVGKCYGCVEIRRIPFTIEDDYCKLISEAIRQVKFL